MKRWIHEVEGVPRCIICKKTATAEHLMSIDHIKKIEEDAIGTLMGGSAGSTRRFNGDMCTGVPTKKKLQMFWGDALENLPQAAMDVHRRKGVFHYGKKKTITPQEAKYELGIVSYPGTGKYGDCLYIPYVELPDVEDVASAEQLQMKSPPGQGWWPVIALQTVAATPGKKILVVCWYQLRSDGQVNCWWISVQVARAACMVIHRAAPRHTTAAGSRRERC